MFIELILYCHRLTTYLQWPEFTVNFREDFTLEVLEPSNSAVMSLIHGIRE